MAISIRQFNVELYREHLEEASFLYEHRLVYLHDPEVNWPHLRDWEERLEAHIDALLVGGDLALDVCRQQAAAGDAGEKHAALRVFCRCGRKDDALTVLRALDPTDEEAVRAASHALRCDAPREWRDELLQLAQGDQPHLTRALAHVIGYRRFRVEDALRSKLAEQPLFGQGELAWALGRVGTVASVPVLWPLLDSDDDRVCEAAAIALMRLGDDRPVRRAMETAATRRWARRVLAIGGDQKAVRLLIRTLTGTTADEDAVLALGLLGDLAAVAPLLELLDHKELSASAAVALNTITGATLHARVFVPDTVDPDELSDEERQAYDTDGTVPTREGRPYGNWERRPLVEKAGWQSWLDQNKHRFKRELRWRMGRPYGPSALRECLRSETSPFAVRSATYEELVVRYGLDVPYEVDLRVSQQRRFLATIDEWVVGQSGLFTDGRWYFGGQLQG